MASTTKMRTVEDVEEENRLKPPPGRRPILPRVYEAWTDEFDPDDEEFERIREPGVHDGSEEDFQRPYPKKTRKQRAIECRNRYEQFLQQEEDERLRQAEAQRLEDLRFPTKLGWFYTNGYYEQYQPFGIKSELLDSFHDMERTFEENRRKREPETFADKFKRHFWPPKLLFKNKIFRTRGSYLDFPEVMANEIADVGIDFGKKNKGLLSNADSTLNDDDPSGKGDGDGSGEPIIPGSKTELALKMEGQLGGVGGSTIPINIGDFNVGWEDYYYDDEKGQFFLKVPGLEIEYYFDGHNSCWRRKRGKRKPQDQTTPYDYYFEEGEFYPREQYWGKHTLDISFDDKFGIWKYDPKESTRIKIQAGIFENKNKGPDNNSKNEKQGGGKNTGRRKSSMVKKEKKDGEITPDDFYFDEMETIWKKKIDAPSDIRIENDENGRRWIRRYEGDWRGLTGNSPDDYYFDESLGKYQTRPNRLAENYYYNTIDGTWRPNKEPKIQHRSGLTCTDYYFEDGMFKKKEPQSGNLYRRMMYALIYVKKDLPISGLLPDDFYYDHSKKLWLPRSMRMTVLKAKDEELPWSKGNPGKTGVVIPTKDDWFFDIEEGIFIKKTQEGIKMHSYYFDTQEGVWKSIELREKHRLHILPHDFYFNGKNFGYKDRKSTLDTYIYQEIKGIYRSKDGMDENHEDPSDFYFDYEKEMWKVKKDGIKTIHDSSNHYIKKNPERKSPDDYYFDESEGRFYEKDPTISDNKYYFVANEGIYKLKGKKGPSLNGLTSREFYFDDYDCRWKLKVLGQDKDYYWDKNNRFFRHIISMSTRTGLTANDYYFSPSIGTWYPIGNYDSNRGKIINDKLNWDPIRNYERPWQSAAPIRYAKKRNMSKVAPAPAESGWEGKERIPFDKPAHEGVGLHYGFDGME